MAATDAIPVPQKGVAYRRSFRINDSNGDPAAGVTSLAAEISKDAGAFASTTNTPVEIGNGAYFVDLTATEMDADMVIVRVTSSAKETQIYIEPEEAGDIRVNVTQFDGNAVNTTNSRPEVVTERLGTQAKADVNAEADTALTDYDAPTHAELISEINDVQSDIAGLNDPTAATIADAVWDEARADHVGAGSFGEGVLVEDLNTAAKASVNAEADTALVDYDAVVPADLPTNFGDLSITASTGLVDITQSAADKVWSSTTRTLTALGTGIITAASIASAAANKIADHTWRRTLANVAASSDGDSVIFRSPLGAMRKLVNRLRNNAGTLEIYEEDDSTIAGQQSATTSGSNDPITELDTQ